MRKITSEATAMFMSRRAWRKGNTEVFKWADGTVELKLHGNAIATLNTWDVLRIRDAGWQTTTTKERLNGLPGVSIYQKDFQWYLNGKPWDGGWNNVG